MDYDGENMSYEFHDLTTNDDFNVVEIRGGEEHVQPRYSTRDP